MLVLGSTPEFLTSVSGASFAPAGPGYQGEEGLHQLIHCAGTIAQIVLLGDVALVDPLTALIPLDDDLLGRVDALARFWRLWHGLPSPPDKRVTPARRRRLRLMLQAADGRALGASYREIASAVYDEERVAEEVWKTSSLRDAVIGLVQGGIEMISGGYRQLLRYRRRR